MKEAILQKEKDLDRLPKNLRLKFAKIRTITSALSTCYGEGPFGLASGNTVKPVLTADDQLELKAKLHTLIKEL